MPMRDIFGIAVAVMIALLSQIVEPWTIHWWTGMITSAAIATVACSDIVAKQMSRPLTLPIIGMIVCAVSSIGLVIWYFSPMPAVQNPSQLARFHTIATNVSFSSQNHNQLIANIYIQNDAGDADIVVYSATAVTAVSDDQTVIDELRNDVAGLVREGNGIHFKVPAKEMRWFTVLGPVLSIDQVKTYNAGGLTFYFVSNVLINEQGATKQMENCGFVIGNNPNAIIECPRGAPRSPLKRH
jgi:cytochrome b561